MEEARRNTQSKTSLPYKITKEISRLQVKSSLYRKYAAAARIGTPYLPRGTYADRRS